MERIEADAIAIVNRLEQVRSNRKRIYPATIDAVLVFSGPGTYDERLKPDQQEWQRNMDRDRTRAGYALMRELTAARKSARTKDPIRGHDVSIQDIVDDGPFLVYNGIPIENQVLRQVLTRNKDKLPTEKILIIDEVRTDTTFHPIRHTGDQYRSFFQEVVNPSSPLHRIKNVALVAHCPDFVRHPFYAAKYKEEFEEKLGRRLHFWAYGIMSRNGTRNIHIESELPRLVEYAKRGDLASEPEILNF